MSDQEFIGSIERRARAHADDMLDVLVGIAGNPGAKNAERIAAAKEVLDRGYGKPTQAVIALPNKRAVAAQLANMTEEQLLQQISEARAARGQRALPAGIDAADVVDAELVDDSQAASDPWE